MYNKIHYKFLYCLLNLQKFVEMKITGFSAQLTTQRRPLETVKLANHYSVQVTNWFS